jgi:hypothetical protein|nr:MAG TPA: hypothetical protein [Caudoviricetes sp.]DAM73465.1 MAG TPA: hypothetical protein [Caudoviricetes sp.]DAS26346.1 MAG TPA: hypothetical protein [Caudoviricetes sp.]
MWTIIILIILSPVILIAGFFSIAIILGILNWMITTFVNFIYDICDFGEK